MKSNTKVTDFKANAGHGGLKATEINGKPVITKKTNLTEIMAYIEMGILYQGCEQKIMPMLYNFKIKDANDNLLCNIDANTLKDNPTEIRRFYKSIETFFNEKQLKCEITIERLQHLGPEEDFKQLKQGVLDVKVGKKTYSTEELKYNKESPKTLINRIQMNLNECSARKGGANTFQISASSNKIKRNLTYNKSFENYLEYLSQFENHGQLLLKCQLEQIRDFVIDKNIACVGASILYVGNQARLIDPAHYILQINLNNNTPKPDNYNELHQNLVDSLNEQITIIDDYIALKNQQPPNPFQRLDITLTTCASNTNQRELN